MLETATAWLLSHPLTGVAGLAVCAIGVGVASLSKMQIAARHGHPKC